MIMCKFIELNSIKIRVNQIVGYKHWKTDTGVLYVDVYLSFPVNGSHCFPVEMSQNEYDNFLMAVQE
jgi:hypothetical protein